MGGAAVGVSRRDVVRLVARDVTGAGHVAYALSVLVGAVQVACVLLQPLAYQRAVDALIRREPVGPALGRLAAVLLIAVAASAALGQLAHHRAARAARRYRADLVDRVLRLPPYGRIPAPGDLLVRFTSDAEAPGALAGSALRVGIGLTTSVVSFVVLAALYWPVAVLAAVEVAVTAAVARVFVRQQGDAAARYQAGRGELITRLVDAHRGIRTIRAAGTLARERARVLAPLARVRAAGTDGWAAQRDVAWRTAVIGPTARIGVLALAGLAVHDRRLSAGGLLAVYLFHRLATGVLDQVDQLGAMATQAAGARRLAEVLDAPVQADGSGPDEAPPGRGELRLDGVVLRRDGRTLLDGVSLTVPAGAHVAVVGRSGTGKSSLVGLAGRLVDPDAGRVLLDGRDVAHWPLATLRREVAYAFEEPRLFGDTVHAAIGVGAAGAQEVRRAARLARADGFVRRLPRGYDTPLADAPLSGGEHQRLGLARAIARSARLVVLDDATSNLDTATEAEVTAALRTAWDGVTALVVAHRAGTAAGCDLVAWLDDGRVRALAPHAELWRDPAYRAVFHAAPTGGAEPMPDVADEPAVAR